MKKQKRVKCRLWRSFTNYFRRRRSTDGTEAALPPFTDVHNEFSPQKATEEIKIQPSNPTETSKVEKPKKPESPIKPKPIQRPVGLKPSGDLDAVRRGESVFNTDFAKDKIKIRPVKRAPAKYNQKQTPESDSPSRSFDEDFATDDSHNSKDENSASTRDTRHEPKHDASSNEGELSSSNDTTDWSAKVALLAKKPLPMAPGKRSTDEELEERAEFTRVSSKKKMASARSEEAKKLEQDGKENSIYPQIVNLSISESRINTVEREAKAKAAKETAKESNAVLMQPETKLKSNTASGKDSKLRASVSMKEIKRLTEKDVRSGAENVVVEKKSTVESSKLSSSVKDRKSAGKAESLNVESKPEADATEGSIVESKSKAAKHEAALPQKLSKAEKTPKATTDEVESKPAKEIISEAKLDEDNSLKMVQIRESKLKAEGKRVESGGEGNFKRCNSRGSSGRKRNSRKSQELQDAGDSKSSTQEDAKKITEIKKEVQQQADLVSRASILTSVTNLTDGHELLTGKSSREQKETKRTSNRASNELKVDVLQDPNRGSKLIEGRSDDKTTDPVSVAGSQQMLNGEGREDVHNVKNEKNQPMKKDFVIPSVPAKAVQKGKDLKNGLQKDMQAATVNTETEVKTQKDEGATDIIHKRMNKMPDEGGLKEFSKVLQKVQNKSANASIESAVEAPSGIKTENKSDAPTENGLVKPPKNIPLPPKAYRRDLSVSQKVAPVADAKTAPSASLSSSLNSHSRAPSMTGSESKIPSENAETEKSKGDVSAVVAMPKFPPPVVSRTAKVHPKSVESAKDADAAWIGKAKRMSKDYSDKMLQKTDIKDEEKKPNGEIETDENFERGGARSSVRDMVKKLQKQTQAS